MPSGLHDSGNSLLGPGLGTSPALGGRANVEVGISECWRYSCFSVAQVYVSLPEKKLSQDLRVGSLVALQEHQGSWALTSAPWFLSPHRKFCLDFTAELGDSCLGNSHEIWYRDEPPSYEQTMGQQGCSVAGTATPGQGTATPHSPCPLRDSPATPCTSHGLSPRPWRLT